MASGHYQCWETFLKYCSGNIVSDALLKRKTYMNQPVRVPTCNSPAIFNIIDWCLHYTTSISNMFNLKLKTTPSNDLRGIPCNLKIISQPCTNCDFNNKTMEYHQ